MILRFRGKDGSYRVSAADGDSFAIVVSQLASQLPQHSNIRIASQPNAAGELASHRWQLSLAALGLCHGDLLFVSYDSPQAEPELAEMTIDSKLAAQDGKIPRGRGRLCKHGERGMCEYCQPLEPFDEGYRVDHGIKHLSYHAYVRKLQSESSLMHVLSEPTYTVNRNCKGGHAPWPAGICTKCQPTAISLILQRFRMVDHLEFANSTIIDKFIEFWRQTNTQRFGFMVGTYAPHEQVPLGIKAVVHAIYEPPQGNELDGLTFEHAHKSAVEAAQLLGLQVVGMVFTDLVDAGSGDGKAVCKRHAKSYFLSSLEVLLAARFQNEFPSPSKYSESGKFSSKFVTCVISGNQLGEIDMFCYQVSVQLEEMVRADLVQASTNPSVLRIQPPNKDRYVPDIFYKHTNEYKLVVQEDAKPAFPVDYAIVSLTHGFPDSPDNSVLNGFPIENRPAMQTQSVTQLVRALQLDRGLDESGLSDFHLLAYLVSLDALLPDELSLLQRLLEAKKRNEPTQDLAAQVATCSGIATLRVLAQA